ncbi:MAG: hypothetical protein ACO25B_02045 [Chitinophagaceae bacterium]
MRSTIAKLTLLSLMGLLMSSILIAQDMAAINPKSQEAKPESTTAVAKYTGYWIILSGGEYYLVREGNLPPGLVTKNSQNKVENIDLEGLKLALNFRRESHINGKQVEGNYFVIKDESEAKDIGTLNPVVNPEKRAVSSLNHNEKNINSADENKVSGPKTDLAASAAYRLDLCASDWCKAVATCHGIPIQYWQAHNQCPNSTGVCIAWTIPGVYYYVSCTF